MIFSAHAGFMGVDSDKARHVIGLVRLPQWQIEAFRRIEVPEAMQQRFGFPPLGPADGSVKRAVLGENAAELYGLDSEEAETG